MAAGLAAAAPRAARFDLVLSDLGLPDGSGLDLMRELSGRHGLAASPSPATAWRTTSARAWKPASSST